MPSFSLWLLLAFLCAVSGNAVFPSPDWPTGNPEDHGLNYTALQAAAEYARSQKSGCFVVMADGYLVGEWYFRAHLTKTVTPSLRPVQWTANAVPCRRKLLGLRFLGMFCEPGSQTSRFRAPVSGKVVLWRQVPHKPWGSRSRPSHPKAPGPG